jgi:tetratricopeptide (TPR) repeat protein
MLNEAIPDHAGYREMLAINLLDIGITLDEMGISVGAQSYLEDAYNLLFDLTVTYGTTESFRENLAVCCNALGKARLNTREDADDAIRLHLSALESFKRLAENLTKTEAYSEQVAVAFSYYADAKSRGDSVARDEFENAIANFKLLMAEYQEKPTYRDALAATHNRFAISLFQHGDAAQARVHFEAARDLWQGITQGRTARVDDQLAWLLTTCPLTSLRDPDAAQRAADAAVAQVPDNPRFVTTQALVSAWNKNDAQAGQQLQRAELLRGYRTDRDFFVLALIQHRQGQVEQAKRSLDDGIAWMNQNRPYDAPTALLKQMTQQLLEDSTLPVR